MALPTIIAPSILSSDFAMLAVESSRMADCGADWLHVDIMDGHFVPNLTIGPPVVASLRKHTALLIDCHLMVSHPWKWVEQLQAAGANSVTFHLESFCSRNYDKDSSLPFDNVTESEIASAAELAARIKKLGMRAGLALRPLTPLSCARKVLESGHIDLLLIMTVEPGFGGQKFMHKMMDKVKEARQAFPSLNIEVDGGLSPQTIDFAAVAGANVIVAGSAIFSSDDAKSVIGTLRSAVDNPTEKKFEALQHK